MANNMHKRQEPNANAKEKKGKKICATLLDDEGLPEQENGEKTCYALTIPEDMTLNEAQQVLFEAQARQLGLSNERAQMLLDMANRNEQEHKTQYRKQVEGWAEEVRKDKDLGGVAIQDTLAYAKAGLARFDPEYKLYDILQETGYANNPHVIRFLAAIGKAHMEDDVLFGNSAPRQLPRHERLYGKYNK